ncbi:FUSC family protein [Neobacillus mesonae]|nr:FUSC family protein [Neobacillus mesonae]
MKNKDNMMNSTHKNMGRRRVKHSVPAGGKYRDAFKIKPIPLNWFRGIGSAVSVGVPSLIGFLSGNPSLGILASIGGFTFLYVSNETYAQRAVRLFWVAVALTASLTLGALCSVNVPLMVVMFGVVGGLAVLLFNLLQITGPGGMFFVLAYSVGTSMPHDVSALPLNAVCVLLGGLFAWCVGMFGYLIMPYGPENKAVSAVYQSLSKLLSAIGTERFTDLQHQTASLMRQADRTLSSAKVWGKRNNQSLDLLRRLNVQASDIFLSIIDVSLDSKHQSEELLSHALQQISKQIHDRNSEVNFNALLEEEPSTSVRNLYFNMKSAVEMMAREDAVPRQEYTAASKESFWLLLKNAFQPGATVPYTALRYGLVLIVAAAVAYGFHFDRSYWVPLSSAAVMAGGTYIGTLYRGLQRSAGTIIGILIGAAVLWYEPLGLVVPITLMIFQFIVELIYGRNYALAVLFLTPSTLLIGTTIQPALTAGYFISARVIDIIIGSIIGILGSMLLWRTSSSSRLPSVFSETIMKEGQLLGALLNGESGQDRKEKEQELQNALIRFRLLYDNAFAESIRHSERTARLWPAVADCLHLGYGLLAASHNKNENTLLSEESKAFERYFEMLAQSVKEKKEPSEMNIPWLSMFPAIYEDMIELQHSLRIVERTTTV